MPIKILSPEVVSKIAAGEVVERPASVVKELVENALDAGATDIAVDIRGGGINMIRVSDNGSGIASSDVEMAFARHATSKINSIEDLESLSTLGFRGEALPSIAAVADVEILTQTDREQIGSYLRLVGGKTVYREKRVRQRGTTITVHHLFRHFPARLKFLKSTATEGGHIANLVTQYALAFPEVKFSLSVDGRISFITAGNGKLIDVVVEVYSVEIAEKMLNVQYQETGCTVKGMVSPPSLSRSNRSYLSFFVNRRWIHSGLLTRASEEAYQGLLMSNKHPVVILNITLPTQDIDVNVHPSKIEVKFRNNQQVYNAVYQAVRKVVSTSSVPELKPSSLLTAPQALPSFWDRPTPALRSEEAVEVSDTHKSITSTGPQLPLLRVVGQLSGCYIMAEGPEGLYLIDQHAAHERIIFEKVLTQRDKHKPEIQGLLDPLSIELNPRQEEIVKSSGDLLDRFGISLEHFGGRSYLLRALPSVMATGNMAENIRELLDDISEEKDVSKREQKLAQSIACHGAVKAGQTLSMDEMRELVKQLEQAEQPRTCPHGRPTVIHLSSKQLEKEFGRIR